jgi:hypothetical protein
MPQVICSLTIRFDRESPLGTTAIGLQAASPEDVDFLGDLCGFEVSSRVSDHYGLMKSFEVKEPEDSPKLEKLFAAIKQLYGFEPSQHFIVPEELSSKVFGLQRERTYDRQEVEQSPLLSLHYAKRPIAKNWDRTIDKVAEDVLKIRAGSESRSAKLMLGYISPFNALAIHEDLKEALEREGIMGLKCKRVEGSKTLWSLGSEIELPRCLVPVVDGSGHELADTGPRDEGPGGRYFDDHGYHPPELRFAKDEMKRLPPFDIAVTREYVGPAMHTGACFRTCVVTQRFRECLEKLGVKTAQYVPVHVV